MVDMGHDTRLNAQIAGALLKHGGHVRRDTKAGEALFGLGRAQLINRQTVGAGAGPHAGYHEPVGRTHLKQARLGIQLLGTAFGQVGP